MALWLAATLLAFPSLAQGGSAAYPFPPAPIWVYNAWSAYDELSDNVPLNEALAMRELDEILRLRKDGLRFDYYMMDAFWYDPDSGYRTWRAEDWPEGPDRWLAGCTANGIKPGLWFSTNTLTHMHAAPAWRSSLDPSGMAMSLSTGGFLADFISVLDYWYDRGIRMFKFDMADFGAATAAQKKVLSPQEIRLRNARALHEALRDFRRRHPDAVLVAFNGIVGDVASAAAPFNPFNVHWLDVFDSLYSGDPRPSDVPEMDFWRSVDIYSDEMVRHFEQGGVPLSRIDSTSFMVGNTGTNYQRQINAWQGSLLLMLAHGGWIRTLHGNLEALDDHMVRWAARLRAIYGPLQRAGVTRSFGGPAGGARPYGFASVDAAGALYTVVNPAQTVTRVHLPRLSLAQPANTGGRVLFSDAGFAPAVEGDAVSLGPGQLALIGYGRYAAADYDLGREADIRIPHNIEPLRVRFRDAEDPGEPDRPTAIEATIMPPAAGDLRIVMQQRDEHGAVVRSRSDKSMGDVFIIGAAQDGRPLPVEIRYDKVVWSGLSWAVGEIRHNEMARGRPVRLRLASTESDPSLELTGRVYCVQY